MKSIILYICLVILLVSCINQMQKKDDNQLSETSKIAFYQNKMEAKNFQFKLNGSCDDALEDTIHDRLTAYIDVQTKTDSNTIIEFKFIDACCQVFMGDYFIQNDSLTFKFEQVNDEVCSCLCWYRYQLTINEPSSSYKYIHIASK